MAGAGFDAVIGAEIMAGAVSSAATCVGAGYFVAGAGAVVDGVWGAMK